MNRQLLPVEIIIRQFSAENGQTLLQPYFGRIQKMDFKNITVKSHNLTNNQIVTEVKTVSNKTLAYFFSSYDSTICKLDIINNVIYVHKNWNYSTTTTKWFNKFLSIFCICYLSTVLDNRCQFCYLTMPCRANMFG